MPFDPARARRLLEDPSLSEEDRSFVLDQLRAYDDLLQRNPIQGFRWHPCRKCESREPNPKCDSHSLPQKDFLFARTPVQAAFCGNQFGKTCILTVKCYCQHLPEEALPEWLLPAKMSHAKPNEPVDGYLLIPSFKLLETVYLPELRKWAPRQYLLGQSFDKAWEKSTRALHFADGGTLHVFTYEQDADKLVGSRMNYIAYDEPPPLPIRDEASVRVTARGGFEMFAMTPVNISGGGIGWIHNEIWLKREDPTITVVKGSIHDNPLLDKDTVERVLSRFTDENRRAREFGDFVHIGGMVYGGGFEPYLVDPPAPQTVSDCDVVVGIDPGLKNAAFIWTAFDNDNRALVFDEVLLQERTAEDYAKAIRAVNKKWGLKDPLYVIDPSARNRSLTNAESIEALLAVEGIYCMHGQNSVEAGVQQVRLRLQKDMCAVSRDCKGVRGEADLYRMKDRPDGEFEVVKENDHRLDAMRYALMTRLWDPAMEMQAPRQNLGFRPGYAPSLTELDSMYQPPTHPLGSMA